MGQMILGRAGQAVPTLLLISLLTFGLLALTPVDPARMALSAGATGVQLDERDVQAKRAELGLDRPLWERYLRWWGDMARLELGRSFASGLPVSNLIAERLPASATLATFALTVSVGIGLPLGVLSALKAGSWLDTASRVFALLGGSLPGFWLALLGMWLFAAELRWVPALGSFTPQGLILPTLVLAARPMGRLARLTRATMLEALAMECLTVCTAKGLSFQARVWRHALPNALLPVVTVIALDFTALIANAVVVEWVFAWPGIGRLGADAALAGDIPVMMAFVMLVGVIVVTVNVLADIACGIIDPRQRPGAVT
jgi:peptide/nickel transport system permease protein